MAKNDEKLRELCMAGMSNKAIAFELGCKVEEVYARRSALGLTIAKCRQMAEAGTGTSRRNSTEIQAEIGRVEKALAAAVQKTQRCDDRLAELRRELAGV